VYEVYLEHAAERDLKRLAPDIFQRIIKVISELATNPRPLGCRKIRGSTHDWRIRVGDYRIIYEIDGREKTVRIMRVRYRREAYR